MRQKRSKRWVLFHYGSRVNEVGEKMRVLPLREATRIFAKSCAQRSLLYIYIYGRFMIF